MKKFDCLASAATQAPAIGHSSQSISPSTARRTPGNCPGWTDEETAFIKRLRDGSKRHKTLRLQGVKDAIKRHGRTCYWKKLAELGIKKPGDTWTAEEDRKLMHDGAAHSREYMAARYPGRTLRSIVDRLKAIGAGTEGTSAPQGHIYLKKAEEVTGLPYGVLRKMVKGQILEAKRKLTYSEDQTPTGWLYVEKEKVCEIAQEYFQNLSELTTLRELEEEFPLSRNCMLRHARRLGIEISAVRGQTNRLSVDDAAKLRARLAKVVSTLEFFSAKKKEDAARIPTGFIDIDAAMKLTGKPKGWITAVVLERPKAIRMRGIPKKPYYSKAILLGVLRESEIGLSDLVAESGLSTRIIVGLAVKAGIFKAGGRGKKFRISPSDATTLRRMIAARKNVLHSEGGTTLDAQRE